MPAKFVFIGKVVRTNNGFDRWRRAKVMNLIISSRGPMINVRNSWVHMNCGTGQSVAANGHCMCCRRESPTEV